jgi:hypothetical protein
LIVAVLLATTMSMVGAAGPASADQTCGPNVVTTLCLPF